MSSSEYLVNYTPAMNATATTANTTVNSVLIKGVSVAVSGSSLGCSGCSGTSGSGSSVVGKLKFDLFYCLVNPIIAKKGGHKHVVWFG